VRLAVFYPQFGPVGGAELLVAAHARFFQSHGSDVAICTGQCDSQIWASRLAGIPLRTIPAPRSWADRAYHRLETGIHELKRWAPKALSDRDAVVAYNFPTGPILGRARIGARKIWHCCEPPRWLFLREANPYVCSRLTAPRPKPEPAAFAAFEQNLRLASPGRLALTRDARHRAFDRDGIRRVGEIWALSEYSRDTLAACYGRHDAHVVYPMVRFPAAGPSRRGLNRAAPRVLTHSRLETHKNVDTVLRAFAGFHRRTPAARLHVVGEGAQRAALRELAQELGVAGAVTFHGFLPEPQLEQIYTECQLFVLVPFDEPFGMVFPEAAARGLLLVGPDHGGPAEILDGGKIGATVDACSAEALCQAMERVFRQSDAEADGARARADESCRARFGAEPVGRRLLQLLRS
jgi:glycosyltransferase involved in cell wall biosynthesis